MKQWMLGVILAGVAASASALNLQTDQSVLNFVTVKNDKVAELMSFEQLSGHLDESTGIAVITVELDSVASGIDIRNTRMREHLFQTEAFATATYTAQVDMEKLKKLKKGEQWPVQLEGELQLHGKSAPLNFAAVVTHRRDGRFQVATRNPSFVAAADYDLVAGIETLKAIAKLGCIDLVVPVTFDVVFGK